MSELSPMEVKIFSEFFLPNYNSKNNANFFYKDQDKAIINSDLDFYDNEGNVLSIQHTRAVGTENDVDMEIVRPGNSQKLVNDLKNELKIRGVNNCHISINFSNPPRDKREGKIAVYWVSELIRKKYFDSSRKKIFSFSQEDCDIYFKECSKWISEIKIFEDDGLHFGISWSKYPVEAIGLLDSTTRFINAVEKKEAKNYFNADKLILVVDFSPFPFDEKDLLDFKNKLESIKTKFKAVWVYQLWSGARGAFEIYKND